MITAHERHSWLITSFASTLITGSAVSDPMLPTGDIQGTKRRVEQLLPAIVIGVRQ